MWRTVSALLTAAVLLALPAAADDTAEMTLEQVLEKHYEAIGGLDNWQKIESAVLRGNMVVGPGAEAPFTMTLKPPTKMRLEFTVQGMTGVQAYDGETAWMVMPFMGKTDPEVVPDDQLKNMREQADLWPLVDYENKGHKVELLGQEEVEGTPAYKLKLTLNSGIEGEEGGERYHFLDSEHFITIKTEGKAEMQGTEIEFETTIGDYKEVGGLMFPHSIESKPKGAPAGQVITIESVEVNGDVADDLFEMPEKKEPEAGEETKPAG